jgi:Na+/proline symporter
LLFTYLTTDNSYYVAWSAIVVNDVIEPLKRTPSSGKAQIALMRLVMVIIACFHFYWGLVWNPKESILSYIYLTGAIFTAAGVITFVGLYWPRANSAGAYATVCFCLCLPLIDIVCKQMGVEYPLKSHESGLAALLLSFGSFMVFGLISRAGERKWVDFGRIAREEDERLRRGNQPLSLTIAEAVQ